MKDFVSQCCQAKYHWFRTVAGYRPQCKQCGELCNVMAPNADPAEPINMNEAIEDEQ